MQSLMLPPPIPSYRIALKMCEMKFEMVAVSSPLLLLLLLLLQFALFLVECEKQFSVIFVFVFANGELVQPRIGSDRFGYAQLQRSYGCVCADNFQHFCLQFLVTAALRFVCS